MGSKFVRITCSILAVVTLVSTFLGLGVSAASTPFDTSPNVNNRKSVSNVIVKYSDNSMEVTKISMNSKRLYSIEFNYLTNDINLTTAAENQKSTIDFEIDISDGWLKTDSSKMTVSPYQKPSSDSYGEITVRISDLQCRTLDRQFSVNNINIDTVKSFNIRDIAIPESFFTTTSSTFSGESSTETPVESKTILENYTVTDKGGNKLEKITKDTDPFNLTVVYLEYGLEKIDLNDMSSSDSSVFFTNMGGFFSDTGTRGKLERITSSANGIPRFRATFNGLTYEETLGNVVELAMVYDIEEHYIQGKLGLTIKQAETKDKDEDDKEISPLKPYIIIDSFSYGEEEIEAGNEFTLNISYTNTSASIGLENIVMTVVPPEDSVAIAADSNTEYVAAMAPKGTLKHSIEMRALPNAKVGSAEVTVTFTYQYVDSANKVREEIKDLTQKISIPITQLDRFDLDPIPVSDIPAYNIVGQMFYIPINYINRGKSVTSNITATAKFKDNSKIEEVKSANGTNLEPGKSDSLEVGITCNTPGELIGEIEVQYEDEMGKQKTMSQPFSVFVEEPYIPVDNGENMLPQQTGTSKLTIILSVVGSLFIAAPIGYYFVKRNQKKESEIFNEDF